VSDPVVLTLIGVVFAALVAVLVFIHSLVAKERRITRQVRVGVFVERESGTQAMPDDAPEPEPEPEPEEGPNPWPAPPTYDAPTQEWKP
jgi:hypothetical protein